ncbi:MAG: hypothetical protein U0R80_02245 [Nocardioidaceae bacterium]
MVADRPAAPTVWLRALLVGAAALVSGTVAHAAADGLLPSVGALLVLLGLATVGGAWFLRRRAGRLRLVALVVTGQSLVHLALTMLAGHRGDPRTPVAVPTPVVTRDASLQDALMGGAMPQNRAAPDLAWATHLVHHVVEQGPAMAAAHLAGAVALGLWLALGEARLWSVLLVSAALMSARLRRRRHDRPGLPPHAPLRRPAPTVSVVLLLPQLVGGSVSHRGPPRSFAH